MNLDSKQIKELVIEPVIHIDEIINSVDDVINYIVYEEAHVEPEIYITEISHVLRIRSAELHFSQWKILKAQSSLVIAHVEPERHEALDLLAKTELKLLIASLKSVLDYEKCDFRCYKCVSDWDESSLDEELMEV
jgi:hypothetical protein